MSCAKSLWALCLAVAFATMGFCRPDEATVEKHAAGRAKEVIAYEGRWWASSEKEERSGFLSGAGDCWEDAGVEVEGSEAALWTILTKP